MTRDVEERIVAMYFDNEDFEKKAKTTIETLGQLQKGMNLEESAKGFDVFEKIGKTLNFDKAQKGLSKIKSTMNGMGSIFKKVFNLGPIDEAAAAVENFKNRYLNRVLGFDLAHTVANALEGAFRQLTIQPISAGWTQYENKMDSVKTIMSSTGQSIGVVQKHLEDLTTYANKTIYSLSDMTSNLGKFTNNGMKLEDSVSAMKGIANAAADAGQGAQQASMAMYNFSQAMGVGKMTTIDWKSIENANMATTRLKETFMEMAAANGTLQKEFDETTKKYHYYVTKNSKGQTEKDKKKWTEVTAKNFRETLSKDWLTSDAMMHALQIYSGDVIDASTFKSWGITDPEQIKALEKIGKDAYEAATQVRTFTKMMDALREAAQSGWADTFELIFGDMEQGTTLWTAINDVIDPILSKSAEARNNMLQIWAGTNIDTKNEEQELADKTAELDALNKKLEELQKTGKNKGEIEKTISDISTLKGEIGALYKVIAEKKNTPKSIFLDEQGRTGREILFDKETGALFRLIELAQKLGGAFSEAFKSVFGEMNAEKLFNLTKQIGDGVENMFKWFTEKGSEKETSRLEKITTGLKGVFSIVKTVVNFIKIGFNLLKRLVSPVADFLINAFEKFGEFFNGLGELSPVEVFQKLGEGLQKTWEKVKKFFTPQEILDKNGKATGKSEIPVITWLRNTWTKLKETIKTWAFDSGLGEVWTSVSNWWTEFSGAVNSGYEQLKFWWNGSGIPAFFTRMWNEITKLFTPKLAGVTYDGTGRHEHYADSPVVAFFRGIWTGMQSAFDELQNWWNGSGIPAFFTRMWNEITKLFTPKLAGVTYDGTGRHEQYADSPVVAFFKGIWTGMQTAFDELQNWWNGSGIPAFFTRMWNEITKLFTPKLAGVTYDGTGRHEHYADSPVVAFFRGIWTGMQSAFDELQNWWNGSGIPAFFTRMWNEITKLFTPKLAGVTYDGTGRHEQYADSPVVAFFKGIWTGMQSAFDELQNWWNGSGIPAFFTRMWNEITKLFTPKLAGVMYDGTGRHEQYADSPVVAFFKGIWTGIDDAFTGLSNWWNNESGIPEFFQGMWDEVNGWFTPTVIEGKQGNTWIKDPPIVEWLTGVWDSIKEVWNTIVGWEGWSKLGQFLSDTWTWITELFSGSGTATAGASDAAVEAAKNNTSTPEQTEEALGFFERIIGAVSDFVGKIVEAISGAVIPEGAKKFLTNIGDFIEGILTAIGTVLGSFGRVFKGEGKVEDWGTVIATILTAVGGIILKIWIMKKMSGLSDVQSFGTSFLAAAGGILLIASAVSLLTAIDQSKLGPALGAVETLAITIGGFITAISAIGATKEAKQDKITGVERFFTNFINKAASLAMITIILKEIPTIIDAVKKSKESGVENIGEEVLKLAEAIALLFGAVSIITIVLGKLGGKNGIDPKAMLKTVLSMVEVFAAISIIALAVGGIGEAVDGVFGDGSHEAVLEALDKAAEFMQGLGNVIGGFFMGLLGIKSDVAKSQDALQIADLMGEASKAFDEEKISGISRMMTLISNLSDRTVKVDTGKMSEFAIAMGNLGDGIYTIATYVAEIEGPLSEMHNPESIQYKKLEGVLGFASRIGDMFSSFAPYIQAGGMNSNFRGFKALVEQLEILAEDSNLDSLTSSLSKMMTKFSADLPKGDTIEFDGVEIVKKLYDAIQIGLNSEGDLPSFDATSIVDAITLALAQGDMVIAQLVHDMVQKGINLGSGLVENEEGEKLPEYLIPKNPETTEQTINTQSLFGNVDLSDMESTIKKYEELLGGLDTSFANFDMNLPDIGSTMEDKGWNSLFSFEDEEGNSTSMLESLQAEMLTVSEQLNELGGLEVTITPVFDMANMTRDKLQGALDAELGTTPLSANATFDNPTVTIDFKTISSELDMAGIHNKLQSMLYQMAAADSNNQAAINRLGNDISDLADAVSDMKLVLDTGVLVGQITPQIDVALGQRSAKFSRTGVVYVNP